MENNIVRGPFIKGPYLLIVEKITQKEVET